jgi:thioredoxin-like negative regulator of GroEL
MSNFTQINNESDFEEILTTKDKVIALLYATWCPFCISFLSIFKKHTEGKSLNFVLVQDDQEILADKYSVEVVPTVLYFKNGTVAKRLDGILGVGLKEQQLRDFVTSCI